MWLGGAICQDSGAKQTSHWLGVERLEVATIMGGLSGQTWQPKELCKSGGTISAADILQNG
jgi:hypothetical protein